MQIRTYNPMTKEVNKEFVTTSRGDLEEKVNNARKALEVWRETPIAERSKMFKRMARRLINHREEYAKIITTEMGKPLKESIPEVEKCAFVCEYFAKNAAKLLREEKVKTEYKKSYISFEPLGVVGSIMPWNFPMWQAIRFAVPTIIAGNVELLKPSSVTIESGGIEIEKLFKKAKFPENVLQLVIGGPYAGTELVNAKIDAISFTGSTETGIKVAEIATRSMKKIVLELGGSDPFVVLADADLDKAAQEAVRSRFLNCGQSCVAAKRFIVAKEIEDQFIQKFVDATKKLKVGDPMDPTTDMGPLCRESQLIRIEKQVKDSVERGATVLLGGNRIEGHGYFYEPTILGNVKNSMPIAKDEAFGPVASIITAQDENDAIKLANDTDFGLGASLWTANIEKGEALTKKINAGLVYVNKTVRSDPRMPFGGVKKSGIGRELSRYGLLEMVNIKSIIVA
jgi:acyl-CoA reductase-like NAD-dependent aldehyde dehydrogenase